MPKSARYDVLPIRLLIRTVQRVAHNLATNPEARKEMGEADYDRTRDELADMRASLIDRLSRMDRTQASFFPEGSMIEYDSGIQVNANREAITDLEELFRNGREQERGKETGMVVSPMLDVGETRDRVLIKLDDSKMVIEVDPRRLKLRYIRP